MKRCTRCVLPETVPGITFNQDGICNFCLNVKLEENHGEEEFGNIIDSIIKEDNKYDCIVPLSGGRDSAYVLYLAKAKYNMKVLAVNYDHEFRTKQALINMQNACSKLNIDFISYRSKRDIAQKIVKYNIISSISGKKIRFPTLCRACSYGRHSVVYRTAEEYGVPLILWGDSKAESTSDIGQKSFDLLHRKKPKLIQIFDYLKRFSFYRKEYYSLLQRLEFHVPGNSILSIKKPKLRNKNIKEIHVFDYLLWEREKIKDTITRELGWSAPPQSVSTWRTDCMLIPLENHYFYRLFGCGKPAFAYCTMINIGQMHREEALRQDDEMSGNIEEEVRELLENNIGLSKKGVKKILSFQKNDFL